MCFRIGITWNCGHEWRDWVICAKAKDPATAVSDQVRWNCVSKKGITAIKASTTPTKEDFRIKDHKHILRVPWDCSPQCCEVVVGPAGRAIQPLLNQRARLPKDPIGALKPQIDAARAVYKKRVTAHYVKNESCVAAFIKDGWRTNVMAGSMGQGPVGHRDPAPVMDHLPQSLHPGILSFQEKLEQRLANGETLPNSQRTAKEQYKRVKKALHEFRELPYNENEDIGGSNDLISVHHLQAGLVKPGASTSVGTGPGVSAPQDPFNMATSATLAPSQDPGPPSDFKYLEKILNDLCDEAKALKMVRENARARDDMPDYLARRRDRLQQVHSALHHFTERVGRANTHALERSLLAVLHSQVKQLAAEAQTQHDKVVNDMYGSGRRTLGL